MSDGMDEIKAIRAEFQAKDEAYDREFKRINHALGDIRTEFGNIRSEFQSGLQTVFTKLDQRADANRITLPIVLSVVGTILSVAVVAGVIHSMSLAPLHTEDKALEYRITKIEHILQGEVDSGHNPHALSLRMDYIEKLYEGQP